MYLGSLLIAKLAPRHDGQHHSNQEKQKFTQKKIKFTRES